MQKTKPMNTSKIFRILLITVFTATFSSLSFAQNVTDKLIVAVIEKNLPQLLHEEKDQRWEFGIYNLSVTKRGPISFNSDQTKLRLKLPVKIMFDGKVSQEILGAKIEIDCESAINTDGSLEIEPIINVPNSKTKAVIDIPVPESFLNCDGLKIPVTPLLEQLVAENKSNWQGDLENDIAKVFKQLGI